MLLSDSASLLLTRGLRRGVLTLSREREYGTTLSALVGVVLLAQILLVVVFGIEGVHNLLQSRLDLRLQVQEAVDSQTVQEFLVAVREHPVVEGVTYITREQAYERERQRNPELISFLEEFGIKNPFPDTIAVSLKSLSDYDTFTAFVRQPDWKDVVDPTFLSQATTQEQEVRQMLRLTSAGRALTLTFLSLLLCVLLFVVTELTRRRAMMRSEEIFVERLVGAPQMGVLVPFATEAGILLMLSLLLSNAVLWIFLPLLPQLVPALGPGGPFQGLYAEVSGRLLGALPLLLIIELLLVPLIAVGGVYLGMRPQMRRGELQFAGG